MKKIHKMLKINTLSAFQAGLQEVVRGKLWMIFVVFALLVGCKTDNKPSQNTPPPPQKAAYPQEARRFQIYRQDSVDVIEVKSIIGSDTLVRTISVKAPYQRLVALSTSYIGYMKRLGLTDRIVAVGGADYISDSVLYARTHGEEASIPDVGGGATISLEKILAAKPDLIMTFATGGSQDDYDRLGALGLPLLISSEWQEESPLGKAQWIQVFGTLFGKKSLADSIYIQSKVKYLSIASQIHDLIAKDSIQCPKVLVGMTYGGTWYAPGGNSYTAHLIRDAGGCYLWAEDSSREKKLTLEEVIAQAGDVDIWINPGAFGTPEEILAAEPRIKDIKAWKNRQIYQMDKLKGPGGGNDFYEGAVSRPEDVLKDLVKAFHPAILENYQSQWYRNIYIFNHHD